jgi:hypothetical protein
MHSTIHNITFDCADAKAQAMFWAAVTGGTAHERDATPGHVEYAVQSPTPGMPRLYFTTVPEPKQGKNRLHLDVVPPDAGQSDDWQQTELARLVGLGATVLPDQPPGVGWIILADPEGNEFCLEG